MRLRPDHRLSTAVAAHTAPAFMFQPVCHVAVMEPRDSTDEAPKSESTGPQDAQTDADSCLLSGGGGAKGCEVTRVRPLKAPPLW